MTDGGGRVALLVDGENLGSDFAGKLITGARRYGELLIKRVYGGAGRIPAWDAAPGFRLLHSGAGKNSADLLLTIEAMQIVHDGRADVLVIASSDGDFAHLAHHLVERGVRIVGAGEEKAPENFRRACRDWLQLERKTGELDHRIHEVIAAAKDGLLIGRVNPEMRKAGIALNETGAKTWRKYFADRAGQYDITGEGQQSRIRLN